MEELQLLIDEVDDLKVVRRRSATHVQWAVRTTNFLGEVFGRNSSFYLTFIDFPWEHRGTMLIHVIGAREEIEYRHQEAHVEQLDTALGLLEAARLELERKGLANVYSTRSERDRQSDLIN